MNTNVNCEGFLVQGCSGWQLANLTRGVHRNALLFVATAAAPATDTYCRFREWDHVGLKNPDGPAHLGGVHQAVALVPRECHKHAVGLNALHSGAVDAALLRGLI
jgi:hypothetical protein